MSIGGRTWLSTETSRDRSKRDLKSVDIDVDRWEDLVIDETSGDRRYANDSPDRRQSSGKQRKAAETRHTRSGNSQ